MKIKILIYYLYKGIFVLIGILLLPLIYEMFKYTFKDNWLDSIIGLILFLIMLGALVALGYSVNVLIEFFNPKNNDKDTSK